MFDRLERMKAILQYGSVLPSRPKIAHDLILFIHTFVH